MTDPQFGSEPVVKFRSTRTKIILTWAKAIAIVVAAFGAAYTGVFTRGEPQANMAYERLAQAFNELRLQVAEDRAFMRGFLEGFKSMPVAVPVAAPAAAPASVLPAKKCERDFFKPKVTPAGLKSSKPAPAPAPARPQHFRDPPAPLPPQLDQIKK